VWRRKALTDQARGADRQLRLRGAAPGQFRVGEGDVDPFKAAAGGFDAPINVGRSYRTPRAAPAGATNGLETLIAARQL
jgi:hypothetical protein